MAQTDSLVFFGTGPIALASLTELAKHFRFEAVITKPDHVVHSGAVIEQSVKLWAESAAVSCFQPADSAELNNLFSSQRFSSRLGLVVDYGLIIPAQVIENFELGIVNSHFSLLPEHRGPDPITAAILSGQPKTGVSLMLIVPKIDEGPLLAQAEYKIPPAITIDRLTEDLVKLSNELLVKTLPSYLDGVLKPYPQPDKAPTYTEKLTRSDGVIDWDKPAEQLEREVRGYLGWPGSHASFRDRDVIITEAGVRSQESGVKRRIGEWFVTEDKKLAVQAGEGLLVIEKIKPAGKTEMSGDDFIRGYFR